MPRPSVSKALKVIGLVVAIGGIAVIAFMYLTNETFTPKIPSPVDYIVLSDHRQDRTDCYLITDPREVQHYLRSVSRLSNHVFCEEGAYRLDFMRHTRSVYAMPIVPGAEYLYPRGTLTLVKQTIQSEKRGHVYHFTKEAGTRIEALHVALDNEPVDTALNMVKAIIETDPETMTIITDIPLSMSQLTRLAKVYGFTRMP